MTDSGTLTAINPAIDSKLSSNPIQMNTNELLVMNWRRRGESTRLMPSVKNKKPLTSVTLPGKNSIIWVYAIMFLIGAEIPNMNIVT
jgi:hypothetical protein